MITYPNIGRNGRLGNQMFQYAAAKAVAINTGSLFAIPIESHELSQWFNLECAYYSLKDNINLINRLKNYNESVFCYDSRFENITDNTALHGYFQTEKYFNKHEQTIRKDFSFTKIVTQPVDQFMKAIKSDKPLVSIHVRRGDYINLQQFHPLCTKEYYIEAMSLFNDCKFIVFSDDIEWCKQAFGQKDTIIYSYLQNHIEDLCAMSMCDHNIIANSSFSWWGAWLNNNKDKKVIAPRQWFGQAYTDKDTKDIYCEGWVKL
jgi:hypothetical protein